MARAQPDATHAHRVARGRAGPVPARHRPAGPGARARPRTGHRARQAASVAARSVHADGAGRARRRPSRAGRPPAPAPAPGRLARLPAVPLAPGGGVAHRPGPDPRGRPSLGAGSGRRDRVRLTARVRRGRRDPAHRLGGDGAHHQGHRAHLSRRAEPDGPAAARHGPHDGGAGRGCSPPRPRHGRGDDAHCRGHAPRRPRRSGRVRPGASGPSSVPATRAASWGG